MNTELKHKPTVVVIDDEESVREGCCQTLEAEGYRTGAAKDGALGLKLAEEMRPDVALVDLKMPGISGMEVLARLHEIDPHIVSIVITGYGTVASAVEAMKIGAYDYIEKPFSPERITEAVGRSFPTAEVKPGKAVRLPQEDDDEAFIIKLILRKASRDKSFGRKLLYEGRHELAGWALSPPAREAMVSGNRAWIWKRCGRLTAEEREWLEDRPW